MESMSPECTELKQQYDDCFNRWYSEKFLRGDLDTSACQELFEDYKACLMIAIKEKHLDKYIQEAQNRPMHLADSKETKQ